MTMRNISESSNGGINTYLLSHMVVNMFQNSNTADYTLAVPVAFAFYSFLQYYYGRGRAFHSSRQSIVVLSRANKTFKVVETLYSTSNAFISVEDMMVSGRDIGAIAYNFRAIREQFEDDYFKLHCALHDGTPPEDLLGMFVSERDDWIAYREQIVSIWQGMSYCDAMK